MITKLAQNNESVAINDLILARLLAIDVSKLALHVSDAESEDRFIDYFGMANFRDFLEANDVFGNSWSRIKVIITTSGKLQSVKGIAIFLGAKNCVVKHSNVLDGAFLLDGSTHLNQHGNKRSLRVIVSNIAIADGSWNADGSTSAGGNKLASNFVARFKKLFSLTQPATYYIEDVIVI
jgi:hypothetical protein